MVHPRDDEPTIQRPDWLSEAVWPYKVRTAYLDGTPVAYTDEGDGPLLLLVHDGMWSYIWGQVIDRLRKAFRVITLDFPGSGLSPASERPVGLEADSHLLESFIERLDLGPLTLVIHDLGGPVGVGVAARRPAWVQGFVFTQTFTWPPHVRSLRIMLLIMSSGLFTAFNVGTNLIPRLTTSTFGIGRHLDRQARAAFLGPFRDSGPRRRFHTLMGAARSERAYLSRLKTALRTTLSDKPVLTVYGERNDPFGFQATFKEIFPDAEEKVVFGGNHFPMADDPDGFARQLTAWHRKNVYVGRRQDANWSGRPE